LFHFVVTLYRFLSLFLLTLEEGGEFRLEVLAENAVGALYWIVYKFRGCLILELKIIT
jgi:hypothetical protein